MLGGPPKWDIPCEENSREDSRVHTCHSCQVQSWLGISVCVPDADTVVHVHKTTISHAQ